MGFDAKILADSMSPDGVRLTTVEITFPRIILAELNTHRMLSKSSASSRAIPLLRNGHMAPLEHVARPATWADWHKPEADVVLGERVRYAPDIKVRDAGDGPYACLQPDLQWSGNLRGWVQYRKTIPYEWDILGAPR